MSMGRKEGDDTGHSGSVRPGVGADFIRTYLGLMGSGKTTHALAALQNAERYIIYGPSCSHESLYEIPYIYDTDVYLKDFGAWVARCPRLRIEKRAFPSNIYQHLSTVRGTRLLLDDVPALRTNGKERSEFDAFVRTVRYNGNQLILTAHRARSDISPLVRHVGTSFYWVGPGTRSRREIDSMYELTNYPISFAEFSDRLEKNSKYQLLEIRRA